LQILRRLSGAAPISQTEEGRPPMSQSAHNPALTAALQALLRSPAAGQAVADKLLDSTDTWHRQSLIADLRARRAWEACDAAAARHEARAEADTGDAKSAASPWHREAAAVDPVAEPQAQASARARADARVDARVDGRAEARTGTANRSAAASSGSNR
jgi:hypothetical protein